MPANLWKVACEEHRYPGLWQRWFRSQCVAVGWPPKAGWHHEGRTRRDHGWARARNSLLKMKQGDWVLVALKLVERQSTRYFVYRTPKWRGVSIESDVSGQTLNGVINVGRTVDQKYLVWSPIETKLYERYFTESLGPHERQELADQILHVIYTVRNNLFHGGKRTDDANDVDVVSRALPLLRMIVEDFLDETLALSG